MRLHLVLADTGRPMGAAVNLLNAGWTFTTAIPLEVGGYTIPTQALAIFIEGSWDELNKPHQIVVELVDDEERPAHFAAGDELEVARIESEVVIPPVPQAPNGTPGSTTILSEFDAGTIRIPEPRRRYLWRVSVGETQTTHGFWVLAPPTSPRIGSNPS